MKLVKRKAEDDLQFILKEDVEADFIHANWLNIKDAHNNIIGTVTGYRINIPLFVNDIFITEGRKSALELDAISQLCSDLWCILYENIDRFKHKSGELLFLNRLELKKKETAKRKH